MIDLTRASGLELCEKIQNGVTLIDFNAPWCLPCRNQEPVITSLDEAYGGRATIAKLNIDENQAVAMKLGIQSIPTMILYKEGREIGRFIGLQSQEKLARALWAAIENREAKTATRPLPGKANRLNRKASAA